MDFLSGTASTTFRMQRQQTCRSAAGLPRVHGPAWISVSRECTAHDDDDLSDELPDTDWPIPMLRYFTELAFSRLKAHGNLCPPITQSYFQS